MVKKRNAALGTARRHRKAVGKPPVLKGKAFRPGDRALIYRSGPEFPCVEGTATILAPVAGFPDMYVVAFDGEEHAPCIRPAHRGDWQDNPKVHLRRLITSWRFAASPQAYASLPFPESHDHD